jgi:hypothetical protein
VRAFCLAIMFAALGLRMVTYATADGANPHYLGSWKLTGATTAPWVDAGRAPDQAARVSPVDQSLVGQTLAFKEAAIAGPAPLACRRAHYRFRDVAAAKIFRGAFEEMQAADRQADPEEMAAAFGYLGPSVKALETGCDVALYFVDASTAYIALNDTIYTLKKQ